MALRDDVLPVFQDARQLIQDLGLRTHRVYFRTKVWSGGRIGRGTVTVTDEEILPRPKVRETEEGFRVSAITPVFSGGGYDVTDLLRNETANTQYMYAVTNPAGQTFECLLAPGHNAVDTGKTFNWSIDLINIERRQPT